MKSIYCTLWVVLCVSVCLCYFCFFTHSFDRTTSWTYGAHELHVLYAFTYYIFSVYLCSITRIHFYTPRCVCCIVITMLLCIRMLDYSVACSLTHSFIFCFEILIFLQLNLPSVPECSLHTDIIVNIIAGSFSRIEQITFCISRCLQRLFSYRTAWFYGLLRVEPNTKCHATAKDGNVCCGCGWGWMYGFCGT